MEALLQAGLSGYVPERAKGISYQGLPERS